MYPEVNKDLIGEKIRIIGQNGRDYNNFLHVGEVLTVENVRGTSRIKFKEKKKLWQARDNEKYHYFVLSGEATPIVIDTKFRGFGGLLSVLDKLIDKYESTSV